MNIQVSIVLAYDIGSAKQQHLGLYPLPTAAPHPSRPDILPRPTLSCVLSAPLSRLATLSSLPHTTGPQVDFSHVCIVISYVLSPDKNKLAEVLIPLNLPQHLTEYLAMEMLGESDL